MRGPLRQHLPRRQLLLFLFTMLIPCGVLVTLGLRMLDHERQQENGRRVEQVRQALLSELERVKLREVTRAIADSGRAETTPEGPVALAAAVRDGTLVLPWEHAPAAAALTEGVLGALMRETEPLAARGEHDEAVRRYRAAATSMGNRAEQVYARLLLAKALREAGRLRESRAEFERVLAAPADLVDELNVPLGLYAASRLIRDAPDTAARVVEWIRGIADSSRPLPPDALRIARDIAVSTGIAGMEARLTAAIDECEQAEALERDFAALASAGLIRDAVWLPYGDPVWLIGVTADAGGRGGLVVAVRAAELLQRLHASAGAVRLATATDTNGNSLGDAFPGLRIVLPPGAANGIASRQRVLAAGLLLVVALTGIAGSLLWRDVRRELRVSDMRSQFVASVSHELRTPLAAIRMFSETLKLDDEVDANTRAEYLDTIVYESERLSRLVDNVLDFGKIERGQKTYRFGTVRLEDVVANAARTAQYPLTRAGFSLDVAIEPGIPAIAADADALQQALLNLLSNAMKYSGSSRRIDFRLARQNGHARIEVADCGVGIAPDQQPRVFDRFYRVPSPENEHIPGTGLGLTIVAHVARAHGGSVDITSTQGHGSTFTMCLPLHDPGSRAVETP